MKSAQEIDHSRDIECTLVIGDKDDRAIQRQGWVVYEFDPVKQDIIRHC